MENLKKLLALEAQYRLRSELMDEFLAGADDIIHLDTYQPMIDEGKFDPDIYIVKTGLIRGIYHDRNMEKTAGFALPGTILISFHCYYGRDRSYYRFEACCPSEVVRIPKAYFNEMLRKHHEFALWILSAHQNQLYYNECKNRVLSSDAKTNLVKLMENISGIPKQSERRIKDSVDDEAHTQLVKRELFTRWNDIFNLVPSRIIASYLGITEQHLSKIKKELLKG